MTVTAAVWLAADDGLPAASPAGTARAPGRPEDHT